MMSISVMINPCCDGFKMDHKIEFYIKNCTFNGNYRHGTIKNGKRLISCWTKRFIKREKYGL